MKLVALSGKSGSGKSFRAEALESHEFQFFAFADPIKEICAERFGFSRRQLWGEGKDEIDEAHGMTPREAVRRVGEFYRQFDPAWWANIVTGQMQASLHAGERLCVTDLRRHSELHALREFTAGQGEMLTVRIDSEPTDDHASETELDDYDEFDLRLPRREDPAQAKRDLVEVVEDFLFEEDELPRLQTALAF
jgi:hypothetical protein